MSEDNILGAILAGGQSKRMGKGKLFIEFNNKKLIEHTIDKVKKYLKKVIIVTNQDNEFFSKNNLTTVKDCIEGQLGPLVGILTAMKWAKENLSKCSWIATFPCDTPFFPESIIKSFIKESEKKESLYLAIINDLSEDIGISTEETKSLVDVALFSTDPRNVNYEQLKQEITTFLFINIFFLICKL